MKFCSQCGNSVSMRIPEGDSYERHICDDCGVIHYQNPKIIVGCLPVYGDQVLLCKRAIEPRLGYWTLPAGFMENGETTQQGALRETWEEAQAKPVIDDLYTLFNLPHISQVYMFYLARLSEPEFAAGDESLEVKLFNEDAIPWDNLAFPVVNETLKYYFGDRKVGEYPIRVCDIERRPRKKS
ncbi:MAG: NUDIX hydrolase [Pseudomonadales bacterium]|nr:NUDIX hydrolase [Pseudomonadales bacterium]